MTGTSRSINICRTDSSADYLRHVDETHERRDDCKFCGFRPPDKAHLERHLERDTKNCQYCDFVTCKEVALARHLIDHLQNKVGGTVTLPTWSLLYKDFDHCLSFF